MLLNSFTTAAQALVAPAMAAGERRRARRLANRCVQLAVMFGAALSVIHLAAGLRLPTLFTSSRNVAQIATNCIRIAAVCTPLNGAVFALDGVLSACCDFQYVSAAIAFASLLGCVALTVGRVLGGGASGVWASINLLMIARAVVLFWRYNSPRSPIPSLFTYSRKRIICADKKSGEENSASL